MAETKKLKLSPVPVHRDMLSYRVVSTPNGQKYGKPGFVPCNHHIEFDYPDCTRTLSAGGMGYAWAVTPKA